MKDNFKPILRFVAVSDIHYKDEYTVENDRMALALKKSYELVSGEEYNTVDVLCVVGDFANRGTETQMQAFKKTLDEGMNYDETQLVISVASHEYNLDAGGVEAAYEKLVRIFGEQPDTHKVINGFHFISVSPSHSCRFNDEKCNWVAEQLKIAAADDPQKPIFFFQHPHISGTVSGSVNWGEDDMTPILMNYPQIIDFSGHSHAPINDPRSIHQQHFTCLGTGTLSYFELDEFDKVYGTHPPENHVAAQMLIVEADAENRVRVYPYDLITENFFPMVHKIDEPSNPDSFLYTDEKRYKDRTAPYFKDGAEIRADVSADKCTLTFTQACIDKEYVNDYKIIVREKATGVIVKQICMWSGYYFYNMPPELTTDMSDLKPGTEYTAEIRAYSFWKAVCDKPLTGEFKTL